MSRLADAYRLVEDYRSAELITSALQFISASKMQELRVQFEQNARLFSGVNELYRIIRAHSLSQSGEGSVKSDTVERDIYIGLTTNKRFYGTLNRDVVRAFVKLVATAEKGDFLMVGQTGAQYLQEIPATKSVEKMEFEDDTPSIEDLQRIFLLVSGYPRVFVVYPKFINPFRQDVVMTEITQAPASAPATDADVDYIFEPEIPKMLQFFQNQVRRAIFGRVLLEAELARAAARTMRMHSAKDRAGNLRRFNERNLRRQFATIADIERMESFIGFISWKL